MWLDVQPCEKCLEREAVHRSAARSGRAVQAFRLALWIETRPDLVRALRLAGARPGWGRWPAWRDHAAAFDELERLEIVIKRPGGYRHAPAVARALWLGWLVLDVLGVVPE